MLGNVHAHKFLGLPSTKPRVWVDLSSTASKRAGLAMHSPGRKVLRWAVKVLGWFAWLPIEKIIRGPIKRFEELDGHEVIERIVEGDSRSRRVEYLTLYMGNDSAKTKLTVMVCLSRVEHVDHVEIGEEERCFRNEKSTRSTCSTRLKKTMPRYVIVKLGRTPEAAEAIKNEAAILKRLEDTALRTQVPVVIGDVGHDGIWTWSAQTILPRGKSPVRLQKEHYEFLEALKRIGISHGDFAPWNCSIVGGKLYVWDWEDASSWFEGKDEAWFKNQVKKLLGIDA